MATFAPFLGAPDSSQEFVALDLLQFPDDVPPPPEAPPALEPHQEDTRIIRLTPDQEARLLRQLRAHYDEAIQGRDELVQRRETRYRRYLCDQTLREGRQAWDESGQLFLPMTRATLETLKDELTEALGGSEAVSAKGVGSEDVTQAETKTRFLRYALTELNPEHWDELVDVAEHDALVDGIGYFKVYPYEHPYVVEGTAGDHRNLLKTIVRIDVVDETCLLIPPNATGLQWPECPYLGHQLWVSLDEFPTMARRGFALPGRESISTWDNQGQYTNDERALLAFTRQGVQPDEASGEFNPVVEMVESQELFDLREGEDREFLTVHWFPNVGARLGNTQTGHVCRVMRLKDAMRQTVFPRPMWPFFPLTVWQQPRQLRGLSLVDRLESPQDMLNRMAEQMIEHGEVSILPYIFANIALAGDLPNLRRIKPGEVVPLDAMGSVTFSPQQSHNAHYLQQMQVAERWGEQDSGTTSLVAGRSRTQPNEPRTLGGLSLLLQQSQKGIKKQTKHQSRQVRQVMKMYYGLWQAHVQPEVLIPIEDTAGLEDRLFEEAPQQAQVRMQAIGPQELAGPFDITIKVNPEAHLEQQKILLLADKLDALLVDAWPLGRRELWKNVWETLGLQEFDRFYPEGVATIQTMRLLLMQQAEMTALQGQIEQLGLQPGTGPGIAELFRLLGIELPPLTAQLLTAQASPGGESPAPTAPPPTAPVPTGPGGAQGGSLEGLLPQVGTQPGGTPTAPGGF